MGGVKNQEVSGKVRIVRIVRIVSAATSPTDVHWLKSSSQTRPPNVSSGGGMAREKHASSAAWISFCPGRGVTTEAVQRYVS